MKHSKLRTALAAFLAVCMTASLVSCGEETTSSTAGGDNSAGTSQSAGTGNEGDASAIDTSNLNEPGTLPVLKETVPLTILFIQDTNIEDMETNAYTKKLEEDVNLDLSFEFLPAGTDAKQKLAIMISGGDTLPDVFCFNLTPIETYSYGTQGYLLPLNDYVEAVGNYSKAYFESEEGQSIMKYVYSPDGNIYGMPRICQEIGNDYDHRMWINKTWLDALDLEMPTTTDEYYEVLKAFKTQDPNGNGKADEIPLMGNTDGWNQNVWKTIPYAFTYLNDNFDYLQVGDDGKLTVSYIQPEFLDALEYMNKLCSEGLLDPLTFTQKQSEFKTVAENEEVQLLGSMCAGSMSLYQVSSVRKQDMTHMAPLTGPDGVCWTSFRGTTIPDAFGFITKDCSDPVAAYAMFDYMYTRDMSMMARFGEKDVDWKEPDEGAIGLYEDMGYEPCMEYINSIWGTLQNKHWGENHPSLRTYDMPGGQTWTGDPYDSQYMTAQAVPDYVGKVPDDVVLRLVYTQEEADQIAEFKANMSTYLTESVSAFVTGSRPLSDWDNYLAEFEGLGLSNFLSVSQQAYDRMQSME